jgi:diguanylate cyclase (GGDEF)-like protein
VLSTVVVGLAVAGAMGAVNGWHASSRDTSTRTDYALVRAGVTREQADLRAAYEEIGVLSARDRFFADARLTASLIARLPAPSSSREAETAARIESAHTAALAASAATLARRNGLGRALTLLDEVRIQSADAQLGLRVPAAARWPGTPLQWLEATDILLVLLIGFATLGRAVRGAAGLSGEGDGRGADAEIEALTRAARSDSLTGLANRRAFEDDLAQVIQARNLSGTPFSLMAFDLDALKQINDTQGHQAGDAVIRRVATTLEHEIGDRGSVYRTGGDEFMALLPGSRGWHALTLAHNVQRGARSAVGRRALSIGITESTRTEGRRILLHQADMALYEAKRGKLLAVTYHAGLEPQTVDGDHSAPSEQQKALAAALARAVDAKDAGTRNHSETVSEICVAVGSRLGIAGDRLEHLRLAGLLHDVGKIGVSDTILAKKTALTVSERAELQLHTTVGHSILTSAELHDEALWVLHHHERFDGDGYPTGLAGDVIPLEARIIAVADAFEAMTGTRPYRVTLSPDAALEELQRNNGTQFDPVCVEALDEVFGSSVGRSAAGAYEGVLAADTAVA